MSEALCTKLDDFWDGYLTDPDRDRFETHLATCPDCRAAVAMQQEMTRAVRCYSDRLAPPMETTFGLTVDRRPARSVASVAATIAIAASLLGLALYFAAPASDERVLTEQETTKSQPPSARDRRATARPIPAATEVRSIESSSHVAVVDPSPVDDVTFVMLYPKLNVDREIGHAQP